MMTKNKHAVALARLGRTLSGRKPKPTLCARCQTECPSATAARAHCQRYIRPPRAGWQLRQAKARAMWANGATLAEIAAACGYATLGGAQKAVAESSP